MVASLLLGTIRWCESRPERWATEIETVLIVCICVALIQIDLLQNGIPQPVLSKSPNIQISEVST